MVELSSEPEGLTSEPMLLPHSPPGCTGSLPRSKVPYTRKDESLWAGVWRPGIPCLPDLAAVGPGYEDL